MTNINNLTANSLPYASKAQSVKAGSAGNSSSVYPHYSNMFYFTMRTKHFITRSKFIGARQLAVAIFGNSSII